MDIFACDQVIHQKKPFGIIVIYFGTCIAQEGDWEFNPVLMNSGDKNSSR